MPLIIKPRSLGVMTKTERRPAGASLVVSAFGMFDLAAPDRFRFEGEQGLWMMVAKELPQGAIFDIGMPKPTAEVLVAGHAAAPGGEPVQRMGLAWAIGDMSKSLLVTGDRYWRMAGAAAVATDPRSFTQMPLMPQRCFGGEGHGTNPAGAGFRARERLMAQDAVPLPNIEIPELAVHSIGDTPVPARFGPMAVDAEERLRYAGTYDAAWMKTRAPGLAADADPRLFLFAPEDQRLPGYLIGNEGYGLRNFAADSPEIQAYLPGLRVRCFVGWTDPGKPAAELPLRIDTLWLFAGARRGVIVQRGATSVNDIEAADVTDIMLAYERMEEEPLPVEHYLRIRALRITPETAFKYAFAEHQLAPRLPQETLDSREARRREREAARCAKRREDTEWLTQNLLARSGTPRELWPAIEIGEPEDHGIPMPLSEEIENGEVELAELLDALEALQIKAEAEMDAALARHEPLRAAAAEVASPDAEPGAIDRLLVALGKPDLAAELDADFAQLPDASVLPPEAADKAAEFDKLEAVRDWRGTMLAAARPKVDEAEQLALARARFLGLPEGGPLAHMRGQLGQEDFALPEFGELPDFREEAGEPVTSDELFTRAMDDLEAGGAAPEDTAETIKGKLADIDDKLRTAYPNLVAAPGQAMAALSTARAARVPQPPMPTSSADAIDTVKAEFAKTHAVVTAQIDQAETVLTANLAAIRRSSPEPLKPDERLAPAVACALGDIVVAEARNGFALAGRDLAGADLSGADLAGLDLSGAMLENARLDGARLAGARLVGATLCAASLVGADLSGCDLSEANLCRVDARSARFAGARLVEVSLLGAGFAEAVFDGAELRKLTAMQVPFDNASFRQARVSDCTFMRSSLPRSDWSGATLERVQFMDVDCAGIGLAGARLFEVAFVMARAGGADLSDAELASVMFAGDVDLQGARFARVVSRQLSFQKADLSGADFERGRLDAACFVESKLTGASLRACSLKRALLARNELIRVDFALSNLFEAQLNRADLSGARLSMANLFGADLADATLVGADFSRANLGGTILELASDG